MLYIVAVFAVVLGLMVPLGEYIARAMTGGRVFLSPALRPLERGIYLLSGVQEASEMRWQRYAGCVVLFALAGFLLLYIMLLLQGVLPMNPEGLPGVSPDLAFNIALSFLTNTNWQSYSGETTLSYLSQMAGLTVQNFLSAGTGLAVAVALFRCFTRKQVNTIGNYWVDLTRAVVYVLLPLSLVFALFLASQGVVQSFDAPVAALTPEGAEQLIHRGPVASQIAIKMLGSNGGGYFGVNAAHPFENPTALSNFFQLVSILLLPAAIVYAFGAMIGDRRQAFALLATLILLVVPLMALAVSQESYPNPALAGLRVDQGLGNMEGKEMRFGTASSAAWSVATTATSNGAVNSMHDSFEPLSVFAQLLLMQVGEVGFGGVGSGMYGLLVFVILTVFIGGLMVGRTPEYLGKKLGPFEIIMASFAMLLPCMLTLGLAAVIVLCGTGAQAVLNPGPRAFSEILYAVTSAANNNGSALGGLNANSPFFNTLLGIVMLLGRFGIMIPVLAIAGAVASRNTVPPSSGTMPTHTPLFVAMLTFIIFLLGVLNYAPTLALGPVVEYLQLKAAHE